MKNPSQQSRKQIEATAFALFESSQILEFRRYIAHIIFLVTALASLFAEGYVLYTIAVLASIAGTLAFACRILANARNNLGFALHRIAMLAKAYHMKGEEFDVAHLFSKVPSKIHKKVRDSLSIDDPSGQYSSPIEDSGPTRLRWMIQENAYFNATLYDACADRALKILVGACALLLLCVLLVIPMADGQAEYVLLRIVLLLLSFSIVYDLVERYAGWRVASKVMLDLENELARFKEVPEYRVLLIFSTYHVAIASAHEISSSIYEHNRDKLNDGWQLRLSSLRREWANVV